MGRFEGLETGIPARSPISQKQRAGDGGAGLTAAKIQECRWLKPVLVGQFEFLKWSGDNHLRHRRFIALRYDKKPRMS